MWKTQVDHVTGRGHQRQGMPCQDRVLAMEKNGVTVVALADGAGSAPPVARGRGMRGPDRVHPAVRTL